MINSIKFVFLCLYILFQPLFKGFLKLGQKYKNIFVGFLVQMKTLKFAFEINWPLALDIQTKYCVRTLKPQTFLIALSKLTDPNLKWKEIKFCWIWQVLFFKNRVQLIIWFTEF